jgi:hypothetical protein
MTICKDENVSSKKILKVTKAKQNTSKKNKNSALTN